MGEQLDFYLVCHKCYLDFISLITLIIASAWTVFIFTYLGGECNFSVLYIIIKYGWWSENRLVNIPAVFSNIDLWSLQNKLPIRVPVVLVNLVGRVIWGYRLCDITVSKKLLNMSFSFSLSKLILKFPAIMVSLQLSNLDIIGVNSSINTFKSSFRVLGDRYILPIVNS